jgi:glycosyltransferase involved in cell wall biosynthesis
MEIAEQLQDIDFVMAGGGDLLEEVRAKAPKNVTVIGWVDAATFWSAVDCAISTSDNEGMPVALIEAQLAGLPVIATDVGSNSEVVEDGLTGIITSKNLAELVNAVKKILKDKTLLKSMGESSKARATNEFSLQKMIDKHKEVYTRLKP